MQELTRKCPNLTKKVQRLGYSDLSDFFNENGLMSFNKMADMIGASYQSISIAYDLYVELNEERLEDNTTEKHVEEHETGVLHTN